MRLLLVAQQQPREKVPLTPCCDILHGGERAAPSPSPWVVASNSSRCAALCSPSEENQGRASSALWLQGLQAATETRHRAGSLAQAQLSVRLRDAPSPPLPPASVPTTPGLTRRSVLYLSESHSPGPRRRDGGEQQNHPSAVPAFAVELQRFQEELKDRKKLKIPEELFCLLPQSRRLSATFRKGPKGDRCP